VLWHTDAGYTFYGPAADPDAPDSRDAGELTVPGRPRGALQRPQRFPQCIGPLLALLHGRAGR
jgi:hypothetical protein